MHQPATPTCPQALSNGVSLPDFASFPHGASTLRPQFVRGLGACEVHRVGAIQLGGLEEAAVRSGRGALAGPWPVRAPPR